MSVYLKIKIKSLAAEARIIRREERRQLGSARYLKRRDWSRQVNERSEEQLTAYSCHQRLHQHRVVGVRQEARAAQIAYGFLRGRRLSQIESPRMRDAPWWGRILRLVLRYHDSDRSNKRIREELRDWVLQMGMPSELLPHWLMQD